MNELLRQEAANLAEDAKRLLLELDRDVPGAATSSGECRPSIDILETASTVEVVVDVAGVPKDALRVAIRRDTVLVVGAKLGLPSPASRIHVAERSYGRFARAVRIGRAIDSRLARAVVANGQLRVTLPRVDDRRGVLIDVPVERG